MRLRVRTTTGVRVSFAFPRTNSNKLDAETTDLSNVLIEYYLFVLDKLTNVRS